MAPGPALFFIWIIQKSFVFDSLLFILNVFISRPFPHLHFCCQGAMAENDAWSRSTINPHAPVCTSAHTSFGSQYFYRTAFTLQRTEKNKCSVNMSLSHSLFALLSLRLKRNKDVNHDIWWDASTFWNNSLWVFSNEDVRLSCLFACSPVKSAFNMHFAFLISALLVVFRTLYRHHLCPEGPRT